MADFKIENAEFQAIVTKGILDALTEESKVALLTEAMRYLTQPIINQSYGSKTESPSPLAQAFRDEVIKAARTIVADYLKETNVQTLMVDAITEQVRNMLKERTHIVDSIAYAVGEHIRMEYKND